MSASMTCQLASIADRHRNPEAQGMAASHQKRGEKNRALDPLLARALERLRRHMEDEQITQSALAKSTGLTQGHISKLLSGESPEASFYIVARLALGARVSIDWLVAGAPPPASATETPLPTSSLIPSKTG
jgi:uncharacterized protein (DUF1501 family)